VHCAAPGRDENDPAAQVVQNVCPLLGCCCPDGHDVQADTPSMVEIEPGKQFVHWMAPREPLKVLQCRKRGEETQVATAQEARSVSFKQPVDNDLVRQTGKMCLCTNPAVQLVHVCCPARYCACPYGHSGHVVAPH